MDRKIVTELSLDELLEITKDETQQYEINPVKDKVLQFLMVYNIKKGSHKVHKIMMYKLFSSWNIVRDINRNVFYFYLNEMFGISKEGYVELDKGLINITDIAIKNIEGKARVNSNDMRGTLARDVTSFFNEYMIEPGTYRAPVSLILKIYRIWALDNKKRRTTLPKFIVAIKTLIKCYRHKGREYIDINKETVERLERKMDHAIEIQGIFEKIKTEIQKTKKE